MTAARTKLVPFSHDIFLQLTDDLYSVCPSRECNVISHKISKLNAMFCSVSCV